MDKHITLNSVLSSINQFSCPYDINLHTHTNYSDGSMSPFELYEQANKLGLRHLAITDHHSVEAYKYIINNKNSFLSKQISTYLWTGIEITGLLEGCLVHIIGLGFDISHDSLAPYTQGDSVKGELLQAKNIIKSIKSANGFSILAHPARYKLSYKILIEKACDMGFDGIEVWYDYKRQTKWSPTPFICDQISSYVKKLNLLSTCGTDTHGFSLLKR